MYLSALVLSSNLVNFFLEYIGNDWYLIAEHFMHEQNRGVSFFQATRANQMNMYWKEKEHRGKPNLQAFISIVGISMCSSSLGTNCMPSLVHVVRNSVPVMAY